MFFRAPGACISVTMRAAPDAIASVPIPAPPDDLSLRFANTRYWRGTPDPTEDLRTPADLLRWVEGECHLPAAVLRGVRADWRDHAAADAAFAEAIALREAMFRLFAALSAGGPAAAADLERLNAALQQAPARTRLQLPAEKGGWVIPTAPHSVPLLLAPVLWSAGDLALGPRTGRVRQCANPSCQWLFLDDSKSGNRRWCSMSACGNRAKAHRHYLKQKQAQEAG